MSLAAIWAVLSKLPWKWIGLGLAVLALVLGIYHAGERHARSAVAAKYDKKMQRANHAMQVGLASITRLRGVITEQNTRIDAFRNASEARIAASQQALKAAEKADRGRQAQIAALQRSAGVVRAGESCEASDSARSIWK